MLKDVNVYNVVAYDGVDAYVIKALGFDEKNIKEQFEKFGDLKILEIDNLYEWDDFDQHLAGVLRGEYKLADNDNDLNLAIRRFMDCQLGTELAYMNF